MRMRDLLAAAALMHVGVGGRRAWPSIPDVRPCLLCRKPKRHNNSFCSPECCKAHKAGMRWEDIEQELIKTQERPQP
jgi:hypothetical protein